ncbi:MAG: hypothetical protein E6H96_00970 [Chloroflexi bacterium]|nr:MAG: hypothetical protein E6H96_00970 [Chloroflexota bacterium]
MTVSTAGRGDGGREATVVPRLALRVGLRSALLVALILASAPAVSAGNPNPGIVPPTGHALGVPYADWAGRWWNWVASVPAATNPLLVDNCNVNQHRPVWFVPHTFFGNTLSTSCTVPTGTWLLATGGGVECSEAEGNGTTEAQLRACVESFLPLFLNVRITVDGRDVQNVDRYLFVGGLYTLNLPADNIVGVAAGPTKSVAGG